MKNQTPATPTHIVSTFQPKPADGQGSIAGYECTCTCGLRMTHTFELSLQMDAAEHVAWASKKAAVRS